MDSIFGQTVKYIVYIDDIFVFSDTDEEHQEHLQPVLSLLPANGLVVRPDNCVFHHMWTLSVIVSHPGILPLPDNVSAIQYYPTPTTIKELQRFL